MVDASINEQNNKQNGNEIKQAGAELGQAQLKLGLICTE